MSSKYYSYEVVSRLNIVEVVIFDKVNLIQIVSLYQVDDKLFIVC